MANTGFKTYAQDHGGRVALLFLLFLLALYQLYSAGFSAFVLVCITPIIVLAIIAAFRFRMLLFWALFAINYLIQMHGGPLTGVPPSVPNELIELMLIAIALVISDGYPFHRLNNVMFLTLGIWCFFCSLEVLNDTCSLGINIGAWYTGARMMAFQLMYAFIVYTLYISTPNYLIKYLYFWGAFAFFAAFWVWKQKNIGFTHTEESWVMGPGYSTHVLQGGTLTRYFSIYSDAANFGIGIASTAVAFIIFGITSKLRRLRWIFLTVGIACVWATFPSGTRTAIACIGVGFMFYILLSKNLRIAVPFSIVFASAFFILAFTNIGNGNQQIRRMRWAFDKNDASANQRSINQEVMKKYLKDAPWGIGMGLSSKDVPANNKFKIMSYIPPDSEYVFIWIHTGIIGISIFLIVTALMILGASWIVFFKLKSPSLRGIGAGFVCAMVSQQLGGYGNQVLMQFPNCLVFYGGLAIVYVLPHIEQEWIAYENKELEKQEEKKRLKLEKKRASRV
jgi:hypothetical protein